MQAVRPPDATTTGGKKDSQAPPAASAQVLSPTPFSRLGAAQEQRALGFKVAKVDTAEASVLIQPKASSAPYRSLCSVYDGCLSVATFDRGVQATIDSPIEPSGGSSDRDVEGTLAAANTLKKALSIKTTSPLLPATEVGGTPRAAEARAESAPKTFYQVPEAERKRVMATPEFKDFFVSSTKLPCTALLDLVASPSPPIMRAILPLLPILARCVERLLGEAEVYNAFADYSGADSGPQEGSEELVTFVDVYKDTRYAPHRPVTDVRASPAFNELFLAAYGPPSSKYATAGDVEGCVLVWSLALKQRPEYVFTCQSAVCSALFNKFQPYVIVGGTYGGSIVIWDSRVQIYALEMVGTKNAHNLVSVDTDGRLCQWSLEMMGQPSETLDLKRGSRDVCVECVSFAEAEVNDLCLGSEDGCIMTANIHGNKAGVMDVYEAHGGALTSLHFHPGPSEGSRDYSHLLLSSSVDWSIKLWSSKNLKDPIATFEGADAYIYDVKWYVVCKRCPWPSLSSGVAATPRYAHPLRLSHVSLRKPWKAAFASVGLLRRFRPSQTFHAAPLLSCCPTPHKQLGVSVSASIFLCLSRHPTSPAIFASTSGNGTLELWNLANDWVVCIFSLFLLPCFCLAISLALSAGFLVQSVHPSHPCPTLKGITRNSTKGGFWWCLRGVSWGSFFLREDLLECPFYGRSPPCPFVAAMRLRLSVMQRSKLFPQVPVFSSPKPDAPVGAHLAKSKVAWSSDGRRLTTGDAMGNLEIWNVSSQIYQPRAEDSAKLDRHIEGAKPVLKESGSGENSQLEFGGE
ncbi:dynein intermediate [Cyclospora cayetanensis]|uniref:Dynein intermediate n=1 Tax=Cyclospora cayetanensis TaxID=88456 RepID=A0A1D3D5D2_9EIME|nr:dynein intermediate [Cyclospora cayetanensis]